MWFTSFFYNWWQNSTPTSFSWNVRSGLGVAYSPTLFRRDTQLLHTCRSMLLRRLEFSLQGIRPKRYSRLETNTVVQRNKNSIWMNIGLYANIRNEWTNPEFNDISVSTECISNSACFLEIYLPVTCFEETSMVCAIWVMVLKRTFLNVAN